jgi:hypothetical protein
MRTLLLAHAPLVFLVPARAADPKDLGLDARALVRDQMRIVS